MKYCFLEVSGIFLSVIVINVTATTNKFETLDPRKISTNDGPLVNADTYVCTEDYSPCTCESTTIGEFGETYLVVKCDNVPSFEAVQSVFRRTTAQQIKYFYLTIPLSEGNNSIPADLLSGKAAQSIYFQCSSETANTLSIDPSAFNFSQDYASYIRFWDCDLSELNYSFLTNFNVFTELRYLSSKNVQLQWSSLPLLPSFTSLSIEDSKDFEGFQNLPLTKLPALNLLSVKQCPSFNFLPIVPFLTVLTIDSCPLFNQWDVVAQLNRLHSLCLIGLNSETIENALNLIASSALVNSLVSLSLTQNGLTQVPPQIQELSKLQNLYLSTNEISKASNGSLAFTTPLQNLYLTSNGLTTIEPAAFQGDFRACYLRLEYNSLRRFESTVFKSMLEDMKTDSGEVYVYDNPFECDCHLAWLIRDNHHLLDRVYGGQCSNGTYFSSLNPQGYASCATDGTNPSTTTSTVTTTTITSGAASPYLFQFVNIVYLIISFGILFSSIL